MNEEVIPIFYLYVHSKLADRFRGRTVARKEIKAFLSEWRIPKPIRPIFIRELELFGLIVREDRKTVSMNHLRLTEEKIKEYCCRLKIF